MPSAQGKLERQKRALEELLEAQQNAAQRAADEAPPAPTPLPDAPASDEELMRLHFLVLREVRQQKLLAAIRGRLCMPCAGLGEKGLSWEEFCARWERGEVEKAGEEEQKEREEEGKEEGKEHAMEHDGDVDVVDSSQ